MSTQPTHRLLVIGNGMVGHKFLEALQNKTHNMEVTVLCEEPRLAYDRVHLSSYFEKPRPDLAMGRIEDYQSWGIRVVMEKATHIDRENKTVHTGSRALKYDTLVLATGSYPFVPPIAGKEGQGCFVYRTIEDLEAIEGYAEQATEGVVIGGGLLGLEAAGALKALGVKTHVVEFAPRLMPVQVDEQGGKLLKKKIEQMGITVHTSTATQSIDLEEGKVKGLTFADGRSIEAQMVIFSAGIRPRDELARASGLAVGERGGISINENCQTSDPSIYAIGECALYQGRIYGLVAPGYTMARVVADQLTGGESQFTGADMSTKLKLLGVDVGSFGDAFGQTSGSEEMFFTDPIKGTYKKLVLSSDGKKVLGGVLVGDTSDYSTLHSMFSTGMDIPGGAEHLLVPAPAGGTQIKATLPLTATVCSCENVSKGTICDAVAGGAQDIASLKKCTKAGTGCGGCVPMVTDILKEQLLAMGQEVNNHLCEHFSYSRQELFDLIRIKEYRTFQDVLEHHGQGLGCEICKPAVASILASLYNEYILKKEHAPLQDTNDRFLANMQRDGTYSVVPRVAGGEITPEKLIVLGEVAKKYNLYCKITGGQRIDLFGARQEQLPLIWADLIAAGFESGHAYGKSLRTVKTCVGETWCRYGVQDSTALGIKLEERYKGLRAPHKLKGGVSGCTRECAEAQGKDFGIIATEKGWNLYVAGNGGMKPKHAQLLAADLDEATLVRYLDRFLMYYIRTADRLQRTSVWLEKLEGGMEYLKKVVVEDSLGIGAELEAAMEQHVGTYHCEWQATLSNPEKMKHFRHFINTDESDDNVVMVEERGQIRPAFDFEKADLLPMISGD